MIMLLRCVLFLLILIIPNLMSSQQESYYSLYRYNMNVINPAYAGADAANMLSFTSRSQWASVEDAPNTLALAFSSARENNVGLGISLVSDKVFIEQQTFAYVDFSYKLQTSGESALFLGLKGGGNFYSADPTSLVTSAQLSDPTKIRLSRFSPNIGAGAYFKATNYWVSFSIPRLFNVKRDGDNLAVTAKDRVHTYLGGGVDLPVSNGIYIKPSLMIRKVKGLPTTADITGMVSWQNQFDIGISIRTNSSMALMSMISLGMFDIGYAYETPTDNGLSQLNLRTHELVLRINLGESEPSEEEELEADLEE
jgi:type IX secretion system PorP/SprF family membrane protein